MVVITLPTQKKKEVLDITEHVSSYITRQGILDGVIHVFVSHTTAAVTTADLDPGTDLDMLSAFEAIMPRLPYRHPHNPEHVTDHILASIIGPSVSVPVKNGKLLLGTWQRIVLIELDGPRERKVVIS